MVTNMNNIDLTTDYMGFKLKNPMVASASPISANIENIKLLEDSGASAIVLFSLFEEQLQHHQAEHDYFTSVNTNSFAEALNYFPESEEFTIGPYEYLNLIQRAVEQTDIPIIGSLNGITSHGWIDFALQIQEAGAAAIELNIYYIQANIELAGWEVEQYYVDVIKAVKSTVDIPVAVKLSPFFSSMGHVATQFDEAGADALVLFNRFYQPDFDLETKEVNPALEFSQSSEIRLPLLWIAVLFQKLQASIAATRGVDTHLEAVKYLMAGADAVMTTSALLKHGIPYMNTLVTGLHNWLDEHEYDSIQQLKGCMSQKNVADPSAFERANYIKTLESYRSKFSI
jgi:dihydroorotate dehydrogenase (fumarate)